MPGVAVSQGIFEMSMTEVSEKESQNADVKSEATGAPKAAGLGALLRNEREKRGLSYEQVAQVTRLRKHFLEAMENEAWENLPPSVFVKGFIRSYAKALGLEEAKLLDLYKSIISDEVPPPRPIIEPRKPKWRIVLVLVLIMGALLGVTLYLWLGMPFSERAAVQTETGPPAQIQEEISKKPQPAVPESEPQELVKEQPESVDVAEPAVGVAATGISEPVPEEKELTPNSTVEEVYIASTTQAPDITGWRTLSGIVHLRTWIRIYIDDEAPKEYILQPGSRPQWKAKRGFYVLIGNAAGIDFDFDGKDFKDLGELGQVVSLRLPEGFDREISED